MTNKILGLHHVTAMTDSAERNYKFLTEVLGMRLVKKTVNQDDIHTYHTFFADDVGTAGTDVTFFDFPNIEQGTHGNNSVTSTGLRVPNDAALEYYEERLIEHGIKTEEIKEIFGAKTLDFEEADGQRYRLYSDEKDTGVRPGIPWKKGPVPTEFAIYGLGPIEITISYAEDFIHAMNMLYDFKVVDQSDNRTLLEVGEGGHGAQMIVVEDTTTSTSRQGYGEVHHIALRVESAEDLKHWQKIYESHGIPTSGYVDRFYFESLYARIGHILVELATDGPGFMQDEPYETMGESLSLPPFLEKDREQIEQLVRPFDTTFKN